MTLAGRINGKKGRARPTRRNSRNSSCPPAGGGKIAPSKGRSSPRLRGEGRGEGASPQAQTRGDAPLPVLTHPPRKGGIGEDDLSPQAGRGKGRGEAQRFPARQDVARREGGQAAKPSPAALLAWFDRHRRILPWRARPGEHADPYLVWLSEIMLQQTTVNAVRPYYLRFVAQFPSVAKLAEADIDDVLKLWEIGRAHV